MGRPTIAEQITKAVAEGNLEKIAQLAEKLQKPVKKKKSEPKSKTKLKEKKEKEIIETKVLDKPKHDFITSSRDPNKQRKYITENGEERIQAKVVPFKVVKNRKNNWKDNIKLEVKDIEFDKKVHKFGVRKGDKRPSINKIKAKCSRCNEKKLVWPGEVTHNNWICDDCLNSTIKNRGE